MKKIFAAVLVVAMMFALVACTVSTGEMTIDITSAEGAGKRTIVFNVPIVDTDTSNPDEQGKFFPDGQQAAADYVQDKIGADYTVKFEETADNWVFTVSYSFADIADYNAKTKALVNVDRAVESEAALTSEAADGGANVTFTEPVDLSKAVVGSLLDILYEEGAPFDPSAQRADGKKINDDAIGMTQIKKLTINVGDGSDSLEAASVDGDQTIFEDGDATELAVTGFVSADAAPVDSEPAATDEPAETEESPVTGDNGVVFFAVILLAAAMVLVSRKMVKAN